MGFQVPGLGFLQGLYVGGIPARFLISVIPGLHQLLAHIPRQVFVRCLPPCQGIVPSLGVAEDNALQLLCNGLLLPGAA